MPTLFRLLLAITFGLTLASLASAASPDLPRVFGASVPGARVLPKADSHIVVRGRVVQPDLGAIADLATRAVGGEKPHFVVDVFPGVEFEAEAMTAELRPSGGATLIARLTGVEMGTAVLTVESGVLTATIDYPGGSFLVTVQPDGTYRVAEIDQSMFPQEAPPLVPRITAPRVSRNAGTAMFDVPIDSGRLIDVIVVWTPNAQTAAGGLAAMQSLTQSAVDTANAAYLNSGIAQRLRRVYLPGAAVTYAETTGCGSDVFTCALDAITNNQIANVFGWRNTYAADLVSLFISDATFCGLAWLPFSPGNLTGDPAYGFSVVDQSCSVGNKSFPHELGHNMGAQHDPVTTPGPGAFAYSHGYASPNSNWRTVMAYPGTCPGIGPCNRIAYFSNPNVKYADGLAMGNAGVSNNALTLNETAKVIANYRNPPAVAVTTTYPAYTDLPTTDPLYGYVEFMREAQYTGGCAAGMYCPTGNVTRRQMAAFLERVKKAANYNPPATGAVFTDVPAGSQFAGYIEALKADGITSGCTTPTTYCPDNFVQRDQMAKFILKAKCGSAYVPAVRASTFTDVPPGNAFKDYIMKLSVLGVTSGCGGTFYCPTSFVSRSAMAKFLERAYPFGEPTELCAP